MPLPAPTSMFSSLSSFLPTSLLQSAKATKDQHEDEEPESEEPPSPSNYVDRLHTTSSSSPTQDVATSDTRALSQPPDKPPPPAARPRRSKQDKPLNEVCCRGVIIIEQHMLIFLTSLFDPHRTTAQPRPRYCYPRHTLSFVHPQRRAIIPSISKSN